MGWHAQPTAQMVLDGNAGTAEAMLGADDEGAGFGIAMSGLSSGRLNIAACFRWVARAAFDAGAVRTTDGNPFGGSLLDPGPRAVTLADMATGLPDVARVAAAHLDQGGPGQPGPVAAYFSTWTASRPSTLPGPRRR